MKRILVGTLALKLSLAASAATLNPVQLLNPAGSTTGQAIVSTGASSAPAWGSVAISTLTGILPVANGGTNASSASGTALDNITGFASTGFLTRTGAGTYAFQSTTNGITLGNLAQIAANTLLGNSTGSTANAAAVSVTGCNGAAQALQWTSASGFGCNSTIATSGANANITSLSGLTTALSVAQGGTGRATLTTHGVLVGEGTAAINQLAVGTTGQVLVGATGADPAFGTTVAGLTFTSAITPQSTGGIVGTTTNDNANAGSVGEFITASATAVSVTTGVNLNVTSISLTAGDWDLTGNVALNPAAGTVVLDTVNSINTVSATLQSAPFRSQDNVQHTGGTKTYVPPTIRVSISSTTPVFLVLLVDFTTSTLTADGFIRARRVR